MFLLPGGSDSNEFASNAGDSVQTLVQEDPLEKRMATHWSILAQEISWTREPGGLQSVGSQGGRRDLETSTCSILNVRLFGKEHN